jgi:hypothetical protein
MDSAIDSADMDSAIDRAELLKLLKESKRQLEESNRRVQESNRRVQELEDGAVCCCARQREHLNIVAMFTLQSESQCSHQRMCGICYSRCMAVLSSGILQRLS